MAAKIKITPAELQAQAAEMKALESEFSALFSGVSSELKRVNMSWGPFLSRNFDGKISSAQKSFAQITQELMNGAKVADTCAVTFQSVDSELSKIYGADAGGSAKTSNSFGDIIKEEIAGLPEDAETAGEVLAWIEEQFGKLPDWITSGADEAWDLFVPEDLQDLKDAYEATSDILQGEFGLKEFWDLASDIMKKNTTLAFVCESINYSLDVGKERDAEMQSQLEEQIKEGDILGAVFDGAEGFIDTIIGGTIDVFGDVGGGLVDKALNNIPVVKGVNKVTEYLTGLSGLNDGDGYSIGGLIGEATEKISEGLDAATDFITDATDVVTDAVTDGVKAGINWVKGWFD